MDATTAADGLHIAVVGSTMMDLVAYIDRAPDAGETVVGQRFVSGFGGKGANQAVVARSFGAEVSLIACVGDDAYGTQTLDHLVRLGIDVQAVHQVPGSSGIAPIWVESDGTNRIIIVPGANLHLTAEIAASAVDALASVDVVIGQLEVPQAATAAGFRAARQRGAVTILNPAPFAALDPQLLEFCDWLVPNEHELAAIVGTDATDDDALLRAAATTGTSLLVTLGAAGVAYVDGDDVRRSRAPIVTARDTTGAGDAFIGAFAYGLAAGRDAQSSIDLGLRTASDSVTRDGTQSSFPDTGRCRSLLQGLDPATDPLD